MSKGTLIYPDGEKYFGELENGVPNGKGTMVFPDGARYTGQFLNGNFHGQGEFISPAGVYVGEWENGVPNGWGTFEHPDGTVQEGLWENSEFKGKLEDQKASGTQEQEEESSALKYDSFGQGRLIDEIEDSESGPAGTAGEATETTAKYNIEQQGVEAAGPEHYEQATLLQLDAAALEEEKEKAGRVKKEREQKKKQEQLSKRTLKGKRPLKEEKGKQIVVSFKLVNGRDDDILQWLQEMAEGERSSQIRRALRERLSGNISTVQ